MFAVWGSALCVTFFSLGLQHKTITTCGPGTASFYMSTIGMADITCAVLMVAGPDNPYLQHAVSLYVLATAAGALWDIYSGKLPRWRYLAPLSLGSLVLIRLLTAPRLHCRQTSVKDK